MAGVPVALRAHGPQMPVLAEFTESQADTGTGAPDNIRGKWQVPGSLTGPRSGWPKSLRVLHSSGKFDIASTIACGREPPARRVRLSRARELQPCAQALAHAGFAEWNLGRAVS